MDWSQLRWIVKVILILVLSAGARAISALDIESHEWGGWVTDIVGGTIPKNPDSPFKYLIFVQNRDQTRGDPFSSKIRVSFGTQFFNMYQPLFNGSRYEYRTFETFEVDLREQSKYFFISRLEQRALAGDGQIAVRFRERAVVQIPFGKKSLVIWDEIFFNVNNPNWVNKSVF